MSVMIRNIYVTYSFGYPQFITSCHGLCTALVGFMMLQYRQLTTGQKITVPTIHTLTTGLGPVALVFALSIGCSNLSLLHGNAHFFETMSSLNIPVTFTLGAVIGKPTNIKLIPPLVLVAVAIAVVAFDEVKFALLGAVFVAAGVIFNAFKAQLQSLLMSPGAMTQVFDPVELVCWTSAMTCVIMLLWSLINEGIAPWEQFNNIGVWCAVGISCVNAVILNNAGLFVLKELGPLGQQIIGEMKGILACLGAVAVFGEIITIQQIMGYGLVVVGAQWYNRSQMEVAAEEREAAEKAKLQSQDAPQVKA